LPKKTNFNTGSRGSPCITEVNNKMNDLEAKEFIIKNWKNSSGKHIKDLLNRYFLKVNYYRKETEKNGEDSYNIALKVFNILPIDKA
jgi:hypothetical protein